MKKTNAMRILEQHKISYDIYYYDTGDSKIDGKSVAEKTELPPECVFKTLVTKGKNNYYVFVVPIDKSLNLKKAANATGEKKIEMILQKELLPLTGYIHGGCSPVGMKKLFPTYIDESALEQDRIAVSAGVVGAQVLVSPKELSEIIKAKFAQVAVD